ncbi:hypothetical protein AAFF_G00173250 [Aldrovandia affinis]|uniref:DUF4200 domain-containing protein n=1 Tax=Aldrovandia affinis TaxID=143900 RepID=A0AAD7SYX2_9TELE|nr:hypothetical protein AAFF_G00173250 [Aldrovandia affinis]
MMYLSNTEVHSDLTHYSMTASKNCCGHERPRMVVELGKYKMDPVKTDECRKAKSPFLRPVVLFRKKREEFLKGKSTDIHAERQEKSGIPNYMRSTWMSRVKTCPRLLIQDIVPEMEEPEIDIPPPVQKGGSLQKLTLTDYLEEQREKVYTKFAHAIKREINERLRKDVESELEDIALAERHVEEEEIVFEKLIDEREEKLASALQLSEKYFKMKTQVMEEYEKMTAEVRKLKSDIESFRERLREYTEYKDFLTGLAPAAWREQLALRREQRRQAKLESQKSAMDLAQKGKKKKAKHVTKAKKPPQKQPKKSAKKSVQEEPSDPHQSKAEISDSDEDPEIYFVDPTDIMTALDDLMEEDLFHIQDFQDTLEDMNRIDKILNQTKTETTMLLKKGSEDIKRLNADIGTAEEIASDLELKSKLFSYGEYSVNQDKMIKRLHKEVKMVYDKCMEDVDTSTLSMLSSLEHKVEEIMQLIEELPLGMFDAIERTRETERRQKMLMEKQQLEKQSQIERQRRAAERAASEMKKVTTRKLMYRSQPPKIKKRDSNRLQVKVTQAEKDAEYFFTWPSSARSNRRP